MFTRNRNLVLLASFLLVELLVLAYQVHRNRDAHLLRAVPVLVVAPVEKAVRVASDSMWRLWRDYIDLHGARRETEQLQRELDAVKLDNQRLQDEAALGKRLQVLMEFQKQGPSQTVAAQVISSGGNDSSRVLVIDKGQEAGLRPDMAVMVPDGVIGKVLRVFPHVSQVLLLTDMNSGAACLLESSRVHGILKGQNRPLGVLTYVMNDEKVQIGERVFTSGEDQIYPKGLPVGVVVEARPGPAFQEITVQPFARLNRVEEVLVVIKKAEPELPPPVPANANAASPTAARWLAKPPAVPNGAGPGAGHTVADMPPARRENPSAAATLAKPGLIAATPPKPPAVRPVPAVTAPLTNLPATPSATRPEKNTVLPQ